MTRPLKTPSWRSLGVATCAALLLGSTGAMAAGGGSSRLSEEPIPLNPEADAQITVSDLPQIEAFINQLRTKAGQDANSPEKHLYSLLNPSLKEDLVRWEKEEHFDDRLKYAIVTAINSGLLRRRDMYNADAWAGTTLSDDIKTRLQAVTLVDPVEAARTNRALLHETFPTMVKAPSTRFFPEQPTVVTLFGDPFLTHGNLSKGITLPTGTVIQPSLFLFGTFRTSIQHFESGSTDFNQWVNRLDLFANLTLTPTERILVGFRPLDEDGEFTGYHFDDRGGDQDGWNSVFDAEPETFFLEGDLGELFPFLDPVDEKDHDIGFAVGRQPIRFGNGFIVEDTLDAVGLTLNNLVGFGTSNIRITGLYAWDGLNRNRGVEDGDAQMLGLFTAVDFPKNTIEFDVAYVLSDENGFAGMADPTTGEVVGAFNQGGDSVHVGIGTIQRVGLYSTTLRAHASIADEESEDVGEGFLFFGDASYSLPYSIDKAYVTGFVAVDDYSAAARRRVAQGPLAPAGILFEGAGLGGIGSALNNRANDVAGGAIGYQHFWTSRANMVVEVGGRVDTSNDDAASDSYGIAVRAQKAIGNRYIIRGDAAISDQTEGPSVGVAAATFVVQF